tara:strand:+ start:1351 stop:1470 length:120 start_codon:yes stop_codon:yes gene_type:complete
MRSTSGKRGSASADATSAADITPPWCLSVVFDASVSVSW